MNASNPIRKATMIASLALISGAFGANEARAEFCGESWTPLTAGQNHYAGDLHIANDEENLFVTFLAEEGWYLKKTHVHIALNDEEIPVNQPGNPMPGQFDYQETHDPWVTEYIYVFSLADLDLHPGDSIVIAAHAEMVRVEDGVVVQDETAWGGDREGPSGNRWWFLADYTVAECDDDEVCWEDETAWSEGEPYRPGGPGWAMYTIYEADKEVNLIAGQHYEAGAVTFSAVDNGQIDITIKLNAGWRFEPVLENVKIQGYDQIPPTDDNPAPGQFEIKRTAEGDEITVTVDAKAFYGVHVDVERQVDCP